MFNMFSKSLYKHTNMHLLQEIRENKELQKNTRTDEQMSQQSQVKEYEHVG